MKLLKVQKVCSLWSPEFFEQIQKILQEFKLICDGIQFVCFSYFDKIRLYMGLILI